MPAHPFEVLKVVESESRPGTTYEIRKSHQDGKTYCTCPAWVFKARKGNGVCKHLAAYQAEHHHETIVVMTHTDYENFRRATPEALKPKKLKDTQVKRSY